MSIKIFGARRNISRVLAILAACLFAAAFAAGYTAEQNTLEAYAAKHNARIIRTYEAGGVEFVDYVDGEGNLYKGVYVEDFKNEVEKNERQTEKSKNLICAGI